jgi:subtilisin-like proprotein convertase family protein
LKNMPNPKNVTMQTIMKLRLSKSIVALVLGMTLAANAAVYQQTFNYTTPYTIPDGSQAGTFSSIAVSGMNLNLSAISVTLNLSGGYNGDLYAYLSYNGTLVPLLNRPGLGSGNVFGAAGSGLSSLTLSSLVAAGNNVHFNLGNGDNAGGLFAPDGRNINPLSAPSAFDATPLLNGLTVFNGVNPNGTWTLFFADVVQGGGDPTVLSWSLDITAVPEPVTFALGIFAGVFGLVVIGRSRPVRRWAHGRWVAINTWIDAV